MHKNTIFRRVPRQTRIISQKGGLTFPDDGAKAPSGATPEFLLLKGKMCADGRALLQAQMLNSNDKSLHENPFGVMEEDVTKAASFHIIEEDDVDGDYEQDTFLNTPFEQKPPPKKKKYQKS